MYGQNTNEAQKESRGIMMNLSIGYLMIRYVRSAPCDQNYAPVQMKS